ncbi:diacylglycerol kinase [Sinomonas atrocyanea]|uniref:Diacylglycerol kinase n=1 Tax=Sinomonas atrocyanea TaxID=37927 RepID=A0A127A3X2_9MICC|nr:diacylglycerol kinase family protein [Sinomonas atrocyanea]AMM33484.1 diacylglycerol kinase [Sinomonas atrocyanea]GEB62926.1 sphingosine kinase [Sinomonas atrocyanea]GGG62132.1 sphingosine kinase [Sinomonas atrocyanea]
MEALIVNPVKQGAEAVVESFRARCAARGAEPLVLETTVEDPGAGMAREALDKGAELVVVAGGDGTVRAAAGALAGTGTPLGVVPLGTGNLLARNLGLPIDDPERALDTAMGGAERRIDVAWAKMDDGDELAFVVMAGLGLDATVMANTDDDLKAKAGWFAYVVSAAQNIVGESHRIRVDVDGQLAMDRRQRGVMVGNCGRIQGNVEVFPGAKVDDGILNVLAVAPSGFRGWFRVVGALLSRFRRHSPPDLGHFEGKRVRLASAHPHDIQLDGDHLGQGRVFTARVDQGALTVRAPQGA